MSQSASRRTIQVDPIEELLKANVIVGTMSRRSANNIRWLIGRMRAEAQRVTSACDEPRPDPPLARQDEPTRGESSRGRSESTPAKSGDR